MLGAIIGDTIGSVYEFNNIKTTDFPFFGDDCDYTDDTIMTVAIADWLLNHDGYNNDKLVSTIERYAEQYPCPKGGYGGGFRKWLHTPHDEKKPYNSFGNGSAMRVSACGWIGKSEGEVLELAVKTAAVTHNHPEGIKGAQATALAIFMARSGESKEEIKTQISRRFGYDLSRTCDEIRPTYSFNETCQETVPEAIIAFLESTDFESAIRLAVSLGGDSDTLACITGSIAEAFYGIPKWMKDQMRAMLPKDFLKVIDEVERRSNELLCSTVAGWGWHDGDSVWGMLKPGKKLRLVREASNKHDKLAVALYFSNTKIGYIPKKDNAKIANLMDKGLARQLHAQIVSVKADDQSESTVMFNIYKTPEL